MVDPPAADVTVDESMLNWRFSSGLKAELLVLFAPECDDDKLFEFMMLLLLLLLLLLIFDSGDILSLRKKISLCASCQFFSSLLFLKHFNYHSLHQQKHEPKMCFQMKQIYGKITLF